MAAHHCALHVGERQVECGAVGFDLFLENLHHLTISFSILAVHFYLFASVVFIRADSCLEKTTQDDGDRPVWQVFKDQFQETTYFSSAVSENGGDVGEIDRGHRYR